MSTVIATKFQSDAKQLASKRLQERKKSILVLILRHLADSGYIDAYKKLESEAKLSLDQVSS
ncbi:Katanin p60 ATPase-containing subunit A-like 2 [Trebouxia sp. C0009 RCD-2024]